MTSTKIIFTSCMDAMRVPEQPIWDEIAKAKPDLLLLLGDQIYMDWGLSLSKTPRWKKIVEKEPGGAQAYADEMYQRYKRQWEVPSFQVLMRDMRARQKEVRIVWDDHDFAWNNSVGEPGSTYSVPPQVRAISRGLFGQFAQVLREPLAPKVSYPAQPPLPGAGAAATGVEDAAPKAIEGGELLMLDTRFYRTHRDQDNRHLLAAAPGQGQRATLMAAIANPRGLLIVAGGSPMRHHYRFSEQGWHADGPDDHAYPEYDELIRSSKRPVLYLGGDIHRNAWGGRLPADGVPADKSPVVQAVSSGAAIGRILLKQFTPSYGVVLVEPGAAYSGQVTVQLCTPYAAQAQVNYGPFGYGPGNWLAGVPGTDEFSLGFGEAGLPVDEPELSVLVYRALNPKAFVGEQIQCLPEKLDELYDDDLPPASGAQAARPDWPQPLRVALAPDLHAVTVARLAAWSAQNLLVMEEAFNRALQRGKQSVVFFIHGFNKTFAESLDQAYSVKERYPGCEPILLSWPSGVDGGLLASAASFAGGTEAAGEMRVALGRVLRQFGMLARDPRYLGLTTLIVARSLGGEAVAEALEGLRSVDGNLSSLQGVDRVVLAAPALRVKGHRQWADLLPCPLVVLLNTQDRKIKQADWLVWGDLLGNKLPADMSPNGIYIDVTASGAVGATHDYFLVKLNDDLDALNDRLMYHKVLATTPPPPGFERLASPDGVVLRATHP